MESGSPGSFRPALNGPCLCGSGDKFKRCCANRLSGRTPRVAARAAFDREDYSEGLIECRADICLYTIWHKSHTEPLLRLGPIEGAALALIDLKSLAELVDVLLHCFVKAGKSGEIPTTLERLRSNIKDERWQRKITYFQAVSAACIRANESEGKRELKKLGSMKEETDVETLQLYLDLFRDDLTFSDHLELIERILALAESNVDRLHYAGIRAIQYLLIGDQAKGERELENAVSTYKSSNSANSTSAYDMEKLAESLELLGGLRGNHQLLDEAIDTYRRILRGDQLTPKGRALVLRKCADTLRRKGAWREAIDTYTRAQTFEHLPIFKVFLAECLLNSESAESAAIAMSSIDIADLGRSEYADYVFVMAAIAISSGDRSRLKQAEDLLQALELSDPYFRERRDALLLSVIQTQRTGTSSSLVQDARRALSGMAAAASRYLMLEPNFMGLGIKVNKILEDVAKRNDRSPPKNQP
jgi:tetratricopeptide (TPR) repeat protein